MTQSSKTKGQVSLRSPKGCARSITKVNTSKFQDLIYVSHLLKERLSSSRLVPRRLEENSAPSMQNFIFVGGQTPEKVRPSVTAIRELAKEKFGRDPSHIKLIVWNDYHRG